MSAPTGQPRRPPFPTARVLPQAVLIAVATGLTTTLYGGFFAGWGFLPRLIAVAVAATALALVVAVPGLRPLPTVAACAAGFAVTALPAVLSGTLHDGLRDALILRVGWRALSGGWAAMLSIAAPAPDSPLMLMTPALITWLAGFSAVTVAVRTRSVLGPTAILVGAEAIGLMFASNRPADHLIQTSTLLVLLLLLTLARTGGAGVRRSASPIRAVGIRAALIATIVGVGLLASIVSEPVDASQRFNPRALLTSPLRLPQVLNPLSEVRQQLRLPAPRTVFTVTITGPRPAVGLFQTAALESFDGSQWSSTDSFRVAGPSSHRTRPLPGWSP